MIGKMIHVLENILKDIYANRRIPKNDKWKDDKIRVYSQILCRFFSYADYPGNNDTVMGNGDGYGKGNCIAL